MHIHILKIYGDSFGHVRKHWLEWFRAAFAPLVLYAVGTIALIFFYTAAGASVGFAEIMSGQIQATQGVEMGVLVGLGNFIYFILTFIAGFSLILKGYRYGVLGEGGDHWWNLQLNMRFVKLILYSILIGIFVSIYFGITGGIVYGAHMWLENIALDVVLGVIFLIFGIYLAIRIALLFLLIAIDRPEPLRSTWRLMEGNVWRFFWLMIFIGLSVAIVTGIGMGILTLFGMIGEYFAVIAAILMFFFGIIMWLVYWASLAKAYSLVYQSFTKGKAF